MADEDNITPAPPADPWESAAAEPAAAPRTSGKAIASLVCGIISLLVGIGAVVLGVIAVVLGVIARKEIDAQPGLTGSGMALAGIITGSIGLVFAVLIIALGVGLMA